MGEILTISQPWHSFLLEAIAKVMWEEQTQGWGRSILFPIQSLYMTALVFFLFFFLFSVLQCGFWMLLHRYTEGRKEYIIFLLTFTLFLVEARITPAVPQLEWPPLSGRDSVPLRDSVQFPFVLWRHSQIMFLMPPVSIMGTITKFRKAVFWSYIY